MDKQSPLCSDEDNILPVASNNLPPVQQTPPPQVVKVMELPSPISITNKHTPPGFTSSPHHSPPTEALKIGNGSPQISSTENKSSPPEYNASFFHTPPLQEINLNQNKLSSPSIENKGRQEYFPSSPKQSPPPQVIDFIEKESPPPFYAEDERQPLQQQPRPQEISFVDRESPSPFYAEDERQPLQHQPQSQSNEPMTEYSIAFGRKCMELSCPYCDHRVITRAKPEIGMQNHIFAALCCPFGLCCIPYFVSSCADIKHYCPTCGALLGTYKELC